LTAPALDALGHAEGVTEGALPEHVAANREHWDALAPQWVAPAERNWVAGEPDWGIWGTPESKLQLLPEDMAGLDAIELGCGTAYVPRGWPGGGPGWWASTTPSSS